ncbi:MAG: zinc-ribbon domain-containing protein [Deltaproteobacteria bacterium]|nr:zinc-ribbon domain-containing protein [Deltaproteobacteria bacterium]
MKFACESCQTKYTIPDEKVRGKVLKIRCKKCGSVITVKEEVAAIPEPEAPPVEERTRVADIGLLEKLRQAEEAKNAGSSTQQAAPAYSEPEAPLPVEWYVMINGEQVGPLSPDDLGAKIASNEVSDRSHVWRDGMAEWKRAADVDELAKHFAPPPPPPKPAAPPRAPPSPPRMAPAPAPAPARAAPAPAAAANFDSEDDNVPTVARPRPSLNEFFPEQEPEATAAASSEPDSEPSSDPTGDPLFDDERPSRNGSARAAPQSNLADLMGDLGGDDHEQSGAGPLDVNGGGADPFAAVPDSPSMAKPQIGEQTRFFMKKAGVTNRNPWWKYALFILSIPVLLGTGLYAMGSMGYGGTVMVYDERTGEQKQVQRFSIEAVKSNGLAALLSGQSKAPPPNVVKKPVVAKKDPDVKKGPTPVDPNAGDPKANLTDEQKKKLAAAQQKGPDLGLVGDDPTKDKPSNSTGPVDHSKGTKDSPGVDKAEALKAEDIKKVVDDNSASFNKCVEDHLKRDPSWKGGRINVSLKIGPSGTVLESGIDKQDVASSDVGECLKTRFKRMHFPRFGGEEPQDVEFPLVLANGG